MASENVNIRITGKLRQHMKDSKQSWEWLAKEFEPALRARADDVISRNPAKAKRR